MRRLTHGDHTAQRIALTVTAVFVIAGLTWVFVTDILLYRVLSDPVVIARFETAKGWAFVAVAGILLYAVTLRSATHLARVWRLMAAVIESIADGVLLLGRDRTIAHANPAALRMLRCSRDELSGMGAAEFSRRFRVSYPNGALVPPDRYISQRVFEEAGPLHYKAVLYRGGGELVIAATAAAVRLRGSVPADWVVSVMHDITEVEKLHRMRDQFFAAAAHCLKTPVAIIKANAQALTPILPPPHQGVAGSLQRQCERIDRLVDNLLVLARARSKTLELHAAEIPLEPLVQRIAHEAVWSYRHEVRAEVTGAPRVHADEERLALVMRNLMHEACRKSPAGSRITLHARIEGDRVALGVRYRRLPWPDRAGEIDDEYDDIGIGRAVASTIVEAHGGSWSEELENAEAISWIHLPLSLGASP